MTTAATPSAASGTHTGKRHDFELGTRTPEQRSEDVFCLVRRVAGRLGRVGNLIFVPNDENKTDNYGSPECDFCFCSMRYGPACSDNDYGCRYFACTNSLYVPVSSFLLVKEWTSDRKPRWAESGEYSASLADQ